MYISQKWLRFCEISCTGKGVTSNEQRKALPLHCWGVELQDVYFTFEPKRPGNGETEYSVVKKKFNDYFVPQENVKYERHLFRNMIQKSDKDVN